MLHFSYFFQCCHFHVTFYRFQFSGEISVLSSVLKNTNQLFFRIMSDNFKTRIICENVDAICFLSQCLVTVF